MNYFTTYWTNKTWDRESALALEGDLQDHTAGSFFVKRGVVPGDAVYVITVRNGKLLVGSKIIVGKIGNKADAAKIVGTFDLWEAEDHVIAAFSTPRRWDLVIPNEVTERLEFVSADGKTLSGPLFESAGFLDKQTLRHLRQLTPESAALLDRYLDPLEEVVFTPQSLWVTDSENDNSPETEYESFADGSKKLKYVTFYERNRKNRDSAVKIHGFTCKGCELNFEEKYGSHGKEFIHVHHLNPVSQFEKPRKIDPAIDLTVLCPNCHAMVHRIKSKTLSVFELRGMIKSNRKILRQ